jgi:hypothetical protein
MVLAGTVVGGCGLLEPQPEPTQSSQAVQAAIQKPLSPEETEELMGTVADNWFYGQGVGEAALTAGTIFIFPPYALYVAGNAALDLSGHKQLRVTDALPSDEREVWNEVYEGVTSVPGRVTSGIAGEDFRSRADAKESLSKFVNREHAAP